MGGNRLSLCRKETVSLVAGQWHGWIGSHCLVKPLFGESLMFSFHFCSPLLGTVKDGLLTIGNISAPVYSADEKMKVPDVLFYENVQVRSLSAFYRKKHCPLLCSPQPRAGKIWVHQAQSIKPQELLYSFKEIVQQKNWILSSFTVIIGFLNLCDYVSW